MKTLKMLEATRGSPNGTHVFEYRPGVQEVPEELAAVFIAMGVAEPLTPTPTPTKAKPGPKPKAPNARTGKV